MTSLLLNDKSLTSEQKDFLETIRISGDNLLHLINDVLDFSKIESKMAVLEEQSFEFRGFRMPEMGALEGFVVAGFAGGPNAYKDIGIGP